MNNNPTNLTTQATVTTVTTRTVESIVNNCALAISNSLPYQQGLSTKNYLRWIITEFKTSVDHSMGHLGTDARMALAACFLQVFRINHRMIIRRRKDFMCPMAGGAVGCGH